MDKTPATWDEYLDRGTQASDDFMTDVEEQPQQEREEVIPSLRPGSMAEYFANHVPGSDEFGKIIENMDDPVPSDIGLYGTCSA